MYIKFVLARKPSISFAIANFYANRIGKILILMKVMTTSYGAE